jgi:hypothetical protein
MPVDRTCDPANMFGESTDVRYAHTLTDTGGFVPPRTLSHRPHWPHS